MKFIKTDSVLSKALSLLTAVMMMVTSFGVSFVAAPSEAEAQNTQVTICHATGNGDYEKITLNQNGVLSGRAGNDHQKGDDIIPPFTDFEGQNWDEDGQAIYDNHCKVQTDNNSGGGNTGSESGNNGGDNNSDQNHKDKIKGVIAWIKSKRIPTDVSICYLPNYDLEVNFGDRKETIPFSELLGSSNSLVAGALKLFIEKNFSPCEGDGEGNGDGGDDVDYARLHVTKIVCNDPELIPSWGHGDHQGITSDTAGSFLSGVNTDDKKNCWIDNNWKFQWAVSNSENPGDNTGEDNNWITINGSDNTIPESAFGETNSIWVREVYDSDYVPFLGQVTTKGEDEVSAGLYCHTDGLHYDNYDRVDGLEVDKDYYCVAFNAPVKEPTPEPIGTIDVCKITLDETGKEIGIPSGTTFTIPGLTQSQVANSGQPQNVDGPFQQLPNTVLTSGITGKSMKVGGTEYKNVQCVSHDIYEEGNYYYGEETMNSTGAVVQWEAPRYNDRNTSAPTVYDSSLVDGYKAGTDSSRDTNADGHIKFEGGKRTLIVLNQMKGKGGEPTDPQTATVQLCKVDDNGHNLSGWELSLTSVEPIDTVTVAPDGTTVQSEVLDAGTYLLKASGTYNYRKVGSEGSLADAAFSNRTQKEQNEKGYSEWLLSSGTSSKHLGLQVDNDGALGWGSVFNSGHEYSQVVTLSSDRAIDFLITDNNYKDNSDTLKVEVYRVFSDVTGESGCASIEDVPFGQYEVGEVMQSGWQNVSGLGKVEVNEEEHTFTVENQKIEEDNPSITINATKVVCKAEEFLPNWAGNNNAKNIDQTKVSKFLSDVNKDTSEDNKNCWTKNWEFQWASGTIAPTEPGGYVGYLDDEKWTTISTGTTTIPLASLESEAISVREVLQEGYIPFTYDESNRDNENDVTAELYCSGDGLNYDNLEWVRDLKDGDTVECVAFNAPLPNEGGGGPSNDGGFTTSSRTRTGGFVPTSTVGEILGDSTSIHEGEVLGAADSFPGMPDSGNESQNLIGLIMALQVLLMTAGAFYMKRRMTFWQS